jgi:hypothetical protein
MTFRNFFASLLLCAACADPSLAQTSRSLAGFYHPGVLVNRAQLELVKSNVAAGKEPWKTAFEAANASPLGALSYKPTARDIVECGPFSKPDLGCKDEQRDSAAAYTHALLWFISGDKAHAEKSIEIMNAWSATLTGGHKNSNGPVQAAWCAEEFPRAAEIIRYTYDGWRPADVEQFKKMLATQYVPALIDGSCQNGNKELSMAAALINIGVFNDDRETFDRGVKMWRGRAPAYIYLSAADGPAPRKTAGCDDMPIWGNKGQTTPFVDGLLQESVRDSGHANLGLSSMVNAAETARQQGIDLYAEQADRICAALEFQAQFLPPNNAAPVANVVMHAHPTWEIAYNHFHNRMGRDLPKTAAVLPTIRPTGWNHQMAWETLTHAEVKDVGLPPVAAP